MTPGRGCLLAALAFAVTPVPASAQRAKDETGSIATIDDASGLVTVAAAGQPTQRYQFFVAQAALRARLRPGQFVTLNLKTATARLGGQTIRMRSLLTEVAETPRVRVAQLCTAQQAAMNAALGEVPPGTPTALWTCGAEPAQGNNDSWCRCTPQFSF